VGEARMQSGDAVLGAGGTGGSTAEGAPARAHAIDISGRPEMCL